MNIEQLPAGLVLRDTYTIVRHLGSGAFGDVYLARHRFMGLQALKVFSLNNGLNALEEAFLLSKLGHPNIVRMFEANEFTHDGANYGYFSMEYVEGGTLHDILGNNVPIAERICLGNNILSGLAFAHLQTPPIIHRDISPTNILIDNWNGSLRAKIADFGLAKHVDPESLAASAGGKYVYMAPESFLGKHSTATDVYSAGIVLFELLTGRHPFQIALSVSATSTELAAVVRKSRSQSIPNAADVCPDLDLRWNGFFQDALAHEFESRPSNAQELLKRFLATASPPPPDSKENQVGNVLALVAEAKQLAEDSDCLQEAIATLEKACRLDPGISSRYSDLLSLWKRGIVL